MGCGIALLVVLIAGGGLIFWGIQKGKAFLEEWGENPGLGAVAMVIKADNTYELVEKDLKAGTLTVKEVSTGEVSVWTLTEFTEGSETMELTDDKGRTITIGGSSGKTFTVSEPSEDAAEEAPAEQVMPEESSEPAQDEGV